MQYNLFEFLQNIDDPRRSQGVRFPLPALLAIIIMAILSGYSGLKGFARFAKSNAKELVSIFALKHGVPTFGTIRTILLSLDKEVLTREFGNWMRQYFPQDEPTWIALDGKGLNSTVSNAHESLQSFVFVVSAFAQKSGLVFGLTSFDNGKSGEGDALELLIQRLDLKGAIFTMDAIHTQKKDLI